MLITGANLITPSERDFWMDFSLNRGFRQVITLKPSPVDTQPKMIMDRSNRKMRKICAPALVNFALIEFQTTAPAVLSLEVPFSQLISVIGEQSIIKVYGGWDRFRDH